MVVLAQDEARALGHDWIGTEHLLLGVLREGEGIGYRALTALGLTHDAARERIEAVVGRGESGSTGQIPFLPEAKRALEEALRAAQSFGHHFIGTEHVLLGVAAADPSRLAGLGVGGDAVRAKVVELLGGPATGASWEYRMDSVAPTESVDAVLERFRAEGWEIANVRIERRRRRR